MKSILLMLGALSAAIIFVGCGTAVGRATGVDSSEAEEVLAEKDIQQACYHEFQMETRPGGKLFPSTKNIQVLEEYLSECMPRMELELAAEGGTDVEKAAEAVEQEMEIVRAGAEEVLAEKDIQQACYHEFQMETRPGGKLFPSTKNIQVLEEYLSECMPRMELELAVEGGTDVEKAAEAVEQEMEIVRAGAEEVLAEREIKESAQVRCQRDSLNPSKRKGKPRNIFISDCMREAISNIDGSGDIDSDVEKAVEAAEQEMEIVRAGAEEVLAERDLMALAQARCQQDFYDPSKRKGKPHNIFMNECMRDASGDIDELIDTDIEKAVEAAEQQMAVAKAEADRAEEEREVIRTAKRLCQRDFYDPSKRKGKSRNDFMNECLSEAAANRDASDDIDTDIEKEVDIAEQELEIVKAGAEDVFEERVASLEEKVAELTELLEALQTQ